MTRYLISMAIGLSLVGLTGCMSEAEQRRINAAQEQTQHEILVEISRSMEFLQDPKTGLCFAYLSHRHANHGYGLAGVPCEKVPAKMLIRGKP